MEEGDLEETLPGQASSDDNQLNQTPQSHQSAPTTSATAIRVISSNSDTDTNSKIKDIPSKKASVSRRGSVNNSGHNRSSATSSQSGHKSENILSAFVHKVEDTFDFIIHPRRSQSVFHHREDTEEGGDKGKEGGQQHEAKKRKSLFHIFHRNHSQDNHKEKEKQKQQQQQAKKRKSFFHFLHRHKEEKKIEDAEGEEGKYSNQENQNTEPEKGEGQSEQESELAELEQSDRPKKQSIFGRIFHPRKPSLPVAVKKYQREERLKEKKEALKLKMATAKPVRESEKVMKEPITVEDVSKTVEPKEKADVYTAEEGDEIDPLTGKRFPRTEDEIFDLAFYDIVSDEQKHRYTKIFNDLDADGDKTLTPDEVYEGLRACNDPTEKASFISEATQAKLRNVMRVLNLEENPIGVDVNEFVLAMTLSERLGDKEGHIDKLIADIDRFRKLFRASANDMDNCIGYDEMRTLLASAGKYVSADEAKEYVQIIQLPSGEEKVRNTLSGITFLDFLSHVAFFLMLNKRSIASSNLF
eukprot:Nk52_evm1s578 gene=Nk52_evmTU1s578